MSTVLFCIDVLQYMMAQYAYRYCKIEYQSIMLCGVHKIFKNYIFVENDMRKSHFGNLSLKRLHHCFRYYHREAQVYSNALKSSDVS